MAKELVLPTVEYGELCGKLVDFSDVNALAKRQINSMKFLGGYGLGVERHFAFFW